MMPSRLTATATTPGISPRATALASFWLRVTLAAAAAWLGEDDCAAQGTVVRSHPTVTTTTAARRPIAAQNRKKEANARDQMMRRLRAGAGNSSHAKAVKSGPRMSPEPRTTEEEVCGGSGRRGRENRQAPASTRPVTRIDPAPQPILISGPPRQQKRASNERPGIPVAAPVLREAGVVGQGLGADQEGLLLGRGKDLGQGRGQAPLHEALEIIQHALGNRVAGVVPDDGAQLQLRVEGQAVVDGVDVAVGAEEAEAALAVGVVGDEVVDADLLEAWEVARVLAQREPVLLELGLEEELERAFAVRALAHDRRRHEPPAERFGEEIGGQLALVEPRREIPQRPLTALGLVDGAHAGAAELHLREQRHVAGPGHAALDGDRSPG